MDENKKIAQESEELSRLIGKGITFEVKDIEIQTRKKYWGLKKVYIPVEITRQFKIEEPTLGTLDRLSAEWVEFEIDDDALKSNDGIRVAKSMAKDNAMRLAKVVAIAVMGSSYMLPKVTNNGALHYVEDVERLEHLTALFAKQIKPSQLYQLCVGINAMCNLGDFCNSIRLMCAEKTTGRIEQNKKD